MSEVQRYSLGYSDLYHDHKGRWVLFSDYAVLAERLMAALVKERGCEECWKGQSCGTDCHMNDIALKETR